MHELVDPATLPEALKQHLEDPQLLLNPGRLADLNHALPPGTQQLVGDMITAMREALNAGLSHLFLAGAAVMFVAVLLVFFLKEVPMRMTMEK